MSTELPPADWYPDPGGSGQLRNWDGAAWTEHLTASSPMPAPALRGGTPIGKQLLRASLALFRQNRRMIWLPVLSGVTSAVAFLAVSGAVAAPVWRTYGASPCDVFYLIPGIMVSTFVGVYFNMALAFAANEQTEGRPITVR